MSEWKRTIRRATADDYLEPLRSKILSGEVEPPDEYVVEDRIPLDEAPFVVWDVPRFEERGSSASDGTVDPC